MGRPFLDCAPEAGLVDRIGSPIMKIGDRPILDRQLQAPSLDQMIAGFVLDHGEGLVTNQSREKPVAGFSAEWRWRGHCLLLSIAGNENAAGKPAADGGNWCHVLLGRLAEIVGTVVTAEVRSGLDVVCHWGCLVILLKVGRRGRIPARQGSDLGRVRRDRRHGQNKAVVGKIFDHGPAGVLHLDAAGNDGGFGDSLERCARQAREEVFGRHVGQELISTDGIASKMSPLSDRLRRSDSTSIKRRGGFPRADFGRS